MNKRNRKFVPFRSYFRRRLLRRALPVVRSQWKAMRRINPEGRIRIKMLCACFFAERVWIELEAEGGEKVIGRFVA